jgi:hypothetical protein
MLRNLDTLKEVVLEDIIVEKIKVLVRKIDVAFPEDSCVLSQTVLNLTNTLSVLKDIKNK